MRKISIQLTDNPPAANPRVGLYAAINKAYPDLGLTQDNSTILVVQPSEKPRHTSLTRVQIQKNVSPLELYDFFYDRFDIGDYIVNPYFTAAELTKVNAMITSAEVLAFIATKSGLNFRNEDFWVSISNKDLAGGSTPPNWIMETTGSSIYWRGKVVLQLHG